MRQAFLITMLFAISKIFAANYSENDVLINNTDAQITLAGTLTTPIRRHTASYTGIGNGQRPTES